MPIHLASPIDTVVWYFLAGWLVLFLLVCLLWALCWRIKRDILEQGGPPLATGARERPTSMVY